MKKVVFQKWQIKKLVFWFALLLIVGGVYLGYTTWSLYHDKTNQQQQWRDREEVWDNVDMDLVEAVSKDATKVQAGIYLETLKEFNIKSSYYRVIARIWFRWEGDEDLDMVNHFHVYNGTVNKMTVLADKVEDGVHYQQCSLDVSVFKTFTTKRFPLDSHVLRFYLEPDYTVDQVIMEADYENSTVNDGLQLAGYELTRLDEGTHLQQYDTTYGEPGIDKATIKSEVFTQFELQRDGFGLYAKCFIALLGTSLWVFITMFLCTFHRVDPLGMIPAALFGTVSNIMVGANLLPDALEIGLLEYVNIWGIFTIIGGAMTIININRIRTKYNDNKFATLFGRIMTLSLVFLILLGHILLPISAYIWE